MVWSAVFVLLACLTALSSGISMTQTDFDQYILKNDNCFAKEQNGELVPLGQMDAGPLGQSMENLISLIEKVEKQFPSTSPALLARSILFRFHIEEHIYTQDLPEPWNQNQQVKDRVTLRNLLLDQDKISHSDFAQLEAALTQKERCSMYFMLSHSINETARINSDSSKVYSVLKAYPTTSRGQKAPSRRLTNTLKEPREQGVVSFLNHEEEAIAPARVLFGIIAGLSDAALKTVDELTVSSKQPREIIEKKETLVNPLWAVTLGELVAKGAFPDANYMIPKGLDNFGGSGKWTNPIPSLRKVIVEGSSSDSEQESSDIGRTTVCQTEYTINNRNRSYATLAEIRGGIDGYILGQMIKQQSNLFTQRRGDGFRLSNFLRMYYSPDGLMDATVSVCQRSQLSSQISSTLRKETSNYLLAFLPINNEKKRTEGDINSFINEVFSNFQTAANDVMNRPNFADWCSEGTDQGGRGGGDNKYPIETLSEVIAMVDMSTGELKEQLEILALLANGLDMRRHGSIMTVVANSRSSGYESINREGLISIAWNSTNRGCPTCRLAWFEQDRVGQVIGANQMDVLFLAMNATLRDLWLEKSDKSGVPGRSFLFFNYGYAKKGTGDNRKFYAARNNLRDYHRGVPLLVYGKGNVDDSKDIAYHDDDIFEPTSPDLQQFVRDKLLKRIKETPALFQYTDCYDQPSNNKEYTGYVTPGKMQYWAMYPQYFLKSFSTSWEFKVETGSIKICYSNWPKPEERESNCQTLKADGESTATYYRKNPCHKYSVGNCPPFYWTIIGLTDTGLKTSELCKDERCLSMQQMKWTMRHTGISCNSSFKLGTSVLLPLAILVVSIASYFEKNGKF